MLTFNGKSGNIFYSWFFNGDYITAPSDQNLKVDFKEAGNDLDGAVLSSKLLKFNFNEKYLIYAETTLKINFPKLISAQKARLYEKRSGKIIRLSEMPLNNDKISSVTLPVYDADGYFYLAVMDASFHEDASSVVSDADSVLKNNSKPQDAANASSAINAQNSNSSAQNTKKNTRKSYYCTLSVECKTVLDNMDKFSKNKKSVLPADGIILKSQKVLFYEGESVFDIFDVFYDSAFRTEIQGPD